MAFAFEKLLVYQKSVDFADQVCDLTEQFPARYNRLADQLNRASLSIASNIAEGNGRFTKPDRKHFFGIARGSVQECVPQLELARRRKLVSDELHAKLKADLEEISRMLSGLINGLDNRENRFHADDDRWFVAHPLFLFDVIVYFIGSFRTNFVARRIHSCNWSSSSTPSGSTATQFRIGLPVMSNARTCGSSVASS
jgi:four helix bundle protein